MKISLTVAILSATLGVSSAFSTVSFSARSHSLSSTLVSVAAEATMAESGVPPATSETSSTAEDGEVPTNLPSECGMDYVPLATMLATGQFAEADQVSTRKSIIYDHH